MKILVIGSANVDSTIYLNKFPKEGETVFGKEKQIAPGGKGLNQAIAIKRAGGDVGFLCALGNDEDAKYIKNVLDEDNINTYIVNKNTTTGSAIILVDECSENKIIVVPGANGAISIFDLKDRIEILKEYDIFVLQNEIPFEVNEFVMKFAKTHNKIVAYNPAPMIEIPNYIFEYVDYFTPNETELFACVKDFDSFENKSLHLIHQGVKNVIVTLGKRGSYYRLKNKDGYAKAYKVKAIDTVAAGDTFTGYLLAMLSKNKTIEESIDIASKASALAVSKKGAATSIPFLKEVLNFKI